MLPIIQSLWIGQELSILEKLVISSFIANGHEFHLYVYNDVKGVPDAALIKNANIIIPREDIFLCKDSYAAFADWFRWKLLEKNGHYWVDMDVICLKPFDLKEEVVFGEESVLVPGAAILKFPKNHELVSFMVKRCEHPDYVERYTINEIRLTNTGKAKIINIEKIRLKDSVGWGEVGGPKGLKKALPKFGLLEQGKPFTYFYPIHWSHWKYIFDETLKNDSSLFSDTYGLHFWNEMLRRDSVDKNATFPKDSLIEQLKRKYLFDVNKGKRVIKRISSDGNKKYAVMWASTENLGDDIQTLAAIHLLKKHGIYKYNYINREKLKSYDGDKVHLIMNGWFMHNLSEFPPSDKIVPLFIAFHCNNEKILTKKNIEYLKKYQPIGCRDTHTVNVLRQHGVDAYFSGCLTLAFDDFQPKEKTKYVVDVNTKVDYIPNTQINMKQFENCLIIGHSPEPFNIQYDVSSRMIVADALLDMYRKAELVVTSRLHCVLPCRAFNTDVLFVHENLQQDSRFSGLEQYINGHSGVSEFDYAKRKVDRSLIDDFKINIGNQFKKLLNK